MQQPNETLLYMVEDLRRMHDVPWKTLHEYLHFVHELATLKRRDILWERLRAVLEKPADYSFFLSEEDPFLLSSFWFPSFRRSTYNQQGRIASYLFITPEIRRLAGYALGLSFEEIKPGQEMAFGSIRIDPREPCYEGTEPNSRSTCAICLSSYLSTHKFVGDVSIPACPICFSYVYHTLFCYREELSDGTPANR